jgi:DNA repair exonuclease SbcCD ATPase subunit
MNEVTRSAAVIAEEINLIKSQTSGILSAAYSYAHRSCMEIGKRLLEAKELVPFGEWGGWLESNFEYSESTAGTLMRIYREYGSEQIDLITGKSPAETFEGLSQSQLTELFALPMAARVDFVEEHKEELADGELSIREMRELIRQQKELIEKQEQDIRDNDVSYGELVDQKRAVEEENDKLIKDLTERQIEIEELKKKPVEVVTETVHEPSKAQIKEIEKAATEKTEKKYKDEIEKLNDELKAKDAERDEALRAAEAESLKKLRQLQGKSDPHAGKISYCMEAIGRALSDINNEVSEMNKENPGSGEKMRMRCESSLLGLLNKFGWQI